MNKDLQNLIDRGVGQKIKEARQLKGMSQTQLAEELNLSFQQIQKYEKGKNRVAASRLLHIAQVLDRPIGFFFEAPQKDWPEESDRNLGEWLKLYKELPREMRHSIIQIGRSFLNTTT